MKIKVYYIFIAFLMVLTTAVYWNHFDNPFEFDDEHTIVTNQSIKNINNIPLFFKDATTTSSLPHNQAYRPGLTTLNAIDFYLGGQDEPIPFYYHRSIFLNFLFSGILLFFISHYVFFFLLKFSKSLLAALIVTAFFWIHPANAETINYIIARSDSFSTSMVLLSFLIYLYKPSWRSKYIYLIPIVIGFLVKEHTIMFVPILAIYQLFFEENLGIKDILKKNIQSWVKSVLKILWPIVVSALLFLFSKAMTPESWTSGGGNVLKYMLIQPYVMLHYVNNFIVPANFVIDTDWKLASGFTDERVIIGIFFLITSLFLIYYFSNKPKYRGISFGLLWFFIALLPTSSIFPFAEVMNDHRPFFPYIGLFIAFGNLLLVLFDKLQKRGFIFINIFIIALYILFAYTTYSRNILWGSPELLWKEATEKAPENGRAWMAYGNMQMARGDYQNAEICFQKTKALLPYYSYIYINIAVLKHATNNNIEAEENYKYAISLDSKNPETYYYYAQFLLNIGRIKECKEILTQGLMVSPTHSRLNTLMNQVKNIPDSSVSKLDVAIDLANTNPNHETFLNLSLEYYNIMEYEKCIEAAKKSLFYKPDYDLAYNNICAAYNQLKQWDKAIEACEKALKINPENQLFKGNLQVSYNGKKLNK